MLSMAVPIIILTYIILTLKLVESLLFGIRYYKF